MGLLFGVSACNDGPPERLVQVSVEPSDAVVELDERTSIGRLLAMVAPGPVALAVRRPGHASRELTLQVPTVGRLSVRVALPPLVVPVEIRSEPEAELVLWRGDEALYRGPTPFVGGLPAGPLTLALSRDGYEPESTVLYLDSPLVHRAYLDPEGQLVDQIARFPTAHLPKGLAITGDDQEIWVASLGGTGLRIHDLATGEVLGDVTLPDAGAVEVIIDDTRGLVYATQMETARVYEIDRESREVLRTFETGSVFTKVPILTQDRTKLYASNWKGNAITEIDLSTGVVVRNLPTLPTPRGVWVTPEGDAMYVASYGGGGLGRIDLGTGTTEVVARGSAALRSLVVDEVRGRLYASDQALDTIFLYDLRDPSASLTALAATDPHPNTIDLSPDGRLLLVSNRGADGPGGYLTVGNQRGSMLVIDALTGAVLDAVAGGMQCTALDVSPDGTLVAFSDFRDDQIHVYRLPPHAELAGGEGGRLARHDRDLLDLDYPGKLARYE